MLYLWALSISSIISFSCWFTSQCKTNVHCAHHSIQYRCLEAYSVTLSNFYCPFQSICSEFIHINSNFIFNLLDLKEGKLNTPYWKFLQIQAMVFPCNFRASFRSLKDQIQSLEICFIYSCFKEYLIIHICFSRIFQYFTQLINSKIQYISLCWLSIL